MRKLFRRLTVPPTRRGKVLLASVIAAVVGILTGAGMWLAPSGLPDGAAFAVGDRVVTEEELDRRARSLEALYGIVAPTEPAELDTFRRDLAKSVAVSMILDDLASERRIVISDKQARDMLDRYIAAQFGDDGRAGFVRSLGNVGTSEDAVLDEIKRQLSVGRLMDDVVGEVVVEDDEVEAAFAERKADLGTPERRVVRNIVLGSEAEAQEILDQLRSEVSFDRVAAEHSLDGSTRESGGQLGELTRDQLEGAVGDAVFETRAKGFYGPVAGEFGWNVGRVDGVKRAVPAELDDVGEELRDTLRTEQALSRWRSWLGAAIAEAAVTYAPDYLPEDPDEPPGGHEPGSGNLPKRGGS